MAIAKMTKVMIVSHRSEAADVLEALQQGGVVQILDAERAMVSKEWPELQVEMDSPRELSTTIARLEKAIGFLKGYDTSPSQTSMFQPLVVVEKDRYAQVMTSAESMELLAEAEKAESDIERLNTEHENISGVVESLHCWSGLKTPVEDLRELEKTAVLPGLVPYQHYDEIVEKCGELEGAIEQVGSTSNMHVCIIVCGHENASAMQKALRSVDFEAANFEGMTGTVSDLISERKEELSSISQQLAETKQKAGELAADRIKLQILFDHYVNLLGREQAKINSPMTEQTMLFEGWVKSREYDKLEEIVNKFDATSIAEMDIAEGEEVPVEIDNSPLVRPFEVITRLYGMPMHFEVDPTIFLAPFFALFFGMCLSDAGYGLLMIAIAIYCLKKSQGDKKFMNMFLMCSISTAICGALTGSWFGDAIQLLNISWLNSFRNFFLRFGFDPSVEPMTFFAVSLIIGYAQLMFGITIAFVVKLFKKDFAGAICDHLVWLILLNALVVYGFSRSGKLLTLEQGEIFLKIAAIPAAVIFLFSHREGGIVSRLGMGFYNLASSMFYIGDTLSYVRLMALGMVTAGFASAINQMAAMSSEIKFVGPIIAIVVLLALHSFNLGISVLGSFVHSLRLQYVEFFPKFFAGGGKLFEPLSRKFKYIYVDEKTKKIN